MNVLMVLVGTIFVTNSLDSLMRLYSENLRLTVGRLGMRNYIVGHWVLLYSLILLYQFTPLQIEWIGLVVIFLYAAVAGLTYRRRHDLAASLRA